MKKTVLIGVILIIAQASFAQSFFKRFHFGLKGGANYSNFSEANFETDGLIGYHGGLIMGYELSKNLSVQEDILFSSQGAKATNYEFGKEDIKLDYISVPIVLKYHHPVGVFIEAGPQVSMLVNDLKNTSYEKFAEKIDAGMVAGLGYQFRRGPVKGLGFGARYYYGFTDVGAFNSSSIRSDFKNNTAQASVFYIF